MTDLSISRASLVTLNTKNHGTLFTTWGGGAQTQGRLNEAQPERKLPNSTGSKGPDPEGLMLWVQLPGNHAAAGPKGGRQGAHIIYCPSHGWDSRLELALSLAKWATHPSHRSPTGPLGVL